MEKIDTKILVIGDEGTGTNLLVKNLKNRGYKQIVEKHTISSIEEIKGVDLIYMFNISCKKTLFELGFKKLNLKKSFFIKIDFTKGFDRFKPIGTYYANVPSGNLKFNLYKI